MDERQVAKIARATATRIGVDPDDAESEGYLKAIELERAGEPVTATAIGNRIRDWARSQRRSQTVGFHGEVKVTDPGFGEVDVNDFLARLTPRDRIIVQARMDGDTLEVIARRNGLSTQGVLAVLENVGKLVDF